jgi:uncharacterized protein (TIGR00730 family)
MNTIQSVCVYCGSSAGNSPEYAEAGRNAARTMVARGITIVYGGGKNGLMGVVADTAIGLGGNVVGVIPRHLVDREVAHTGLSRLHITETMHERKHLMGSLADAFVTLPGGFGTLEEFSEVLSWSQMGLHRKPCGFLDVRGYFNNLFRFFDTMVDAGFLRATSRDLLYVEADPGRLIERMNG